MKKIFALMLTALLFAACGDDETEPEPYYNPVEGQWIDYPNDGKYYHIVVFTKKFERYIYIYQNEKFIRKDLTGRYTISDTKITLGSATANYSIIEDTLTLEVPLQTQKWVKNKSPLPN